ncbi:hypothetical protein Tco_0268549 [Tanacetum coccineum]
MVYLCLHFTKDNEGIKINTPYPGKTKYVIASLVGPAGDLWDQRVRSQLIDKDLASGLLVYELPLSTIVYNDDLTSKSNSSTEPVEIPHRIDGFDLKIETYLSECDEEEQNVVYFNELFPFNIIYPDDLESDKDNDDNEIDIIQSSECDVINIDVQGSNKLLETNHDRINMAIPPRDQRHQYLRFEGLEYTDVDIADFEKRLGKIYSREVHRVLVLDFERLPAEMAEGLTSRMLMEHRDAQGQSVFTSHTWRRLFEVLGPLVFELIMEFFSTFRFGQAILDIDAARTLQFYIAGRSQAPEKMTVTDLFYLRGIDVGSFNIPYLLARYLRRLQGLAVIVRDLPVIDMAELARLQIYEELVNT